MQFGIGNCEKVGRVPTRRDTPLLKRVAGTEWREQERLARECEPCQICGKLWRASCVMGMKNTFVTISSAGPNRDSAKGTREQPFWDEHVVFIDRLVDEGFILMGGPLVDEAGMPHGALLIVNAEDENEVREKLKNDPWFIRGILKLESVTRWQIFIDVRK